MDQIRYSMIAIDVNNLYWRSVSTCIQNKTLVQNIYIYSEILQDCIDRINKIKEQYGTNNVRIYLLFDNPTSILNIRKAIDENYKHTRTNKKITKEFWDTLALLKIILQCYANNYYILKNDSCEADDLVYPLIKQIFTENDNLLLISADMDWARGMSFSENIHWFNYSQIYDHKEIFKRKYGFYPEANKVKMYKSIRGDSSDCIDCAVKYLPENILLHIVDNYNTIEDLIKDVCKDNFIPSQWKSKIKENQNKLISNYQLIDFVYLNTPMHHIMIEGKENINELKSWYTLLEIPLESRMLEYKDRTTHFFKHKYKRIKK